MSALNGKKKHTGKWNKLLVAKYKNMGWSQSTFNVYNNNNPGSGFPKNKTKQNKKTNQKQP